MLEICEMMCEKLDRLSENICKIEDVWIHFKKFIVYVAKVVVDEVRIDRKMGDAQWNDEVTYAVTEKNKVHLGMLNESVRADEYEKCKRNVQRYRGSSKRKSYENCRMILNRIKKCSGNTVDTSYK